MTIAVMLLAPKITKAVPAAIAALVSGVLTYFGLAFFDRTLLDLTNNTIVIGPLNVSVPAMAQAVAGRWQAIATWNSHNSPFSFSPR